MYRTHLSLVRATEPVDGRVVLGLAARCSSRRRRLRLPLPRANSRAKRLQQLPQKR